MLSKEEKLKKAAEAKASLEKEYGKGTVISLNDSPDMDIEVISTGSIGLNQALGIGGLPKGRIVEIYGHESSGKTTLCTHIISECQAKGGLCAIIDAEQAFDKEYATKLGVNVDELDINQPDCGEEALEVADTLIKSGAYDVIVVDSVAALVPRKELEGDMGDANMGLHARLMSQAMRKLTASVKKNNVLLIFTNQLRQKMVLMGNPDVTTGGLALKFYASIRLEVVRSTTTDNSIFGEDKEKIGNLVTVKIIKNKLAPPFKKAEFDILYGVGIDKVGEIISLCSKNGTLKKWGKDITYDSVKYNINDFTQMVYDNPDFYKKLEASANQV